MSRETLEEKAMHTGAENPAAETFEAQGLSGEDAAHPACQLLFLVPTTQSNKKANQGPAL